MGTTSQEFRPEARSAGRVLDFPPPELLFKPQSQVLKAPCAEQAGRAGCSCTLHRRVQVPAGQPARPGVGGRRGRSRGPRSGRRGPRDSPAAAPVSLARAGGQPPRHVRAGTAPWGGVGTWRALSTEGTVSLNRTSPNTEAKQVSPHERATREAACAHTRTRLRKRECYSAPRGESCHRLQHGAPEDVVLSETSQSPQNSVGFHLREVPRAATSAETGWWARTRRECSVRRVRGWDAAGSGDGPGGGCVMRRRLTPLTAHLKVVKMVYYMLYVFYQHLKKKL